MSKTYRRDSNYRPKGGKDFKKFKKSNKFKKWNDRPNKPTTTPDEPPKDIDTDVFSD
jgi:hypothetical protein